MATVDTNFEATGPASQGFLADGDYKTGVHGVGRIQSDDVDLGVVGVIGSTGADPLTDKSGVGVLGRTVSGIGVSGVSSSNQITMARPGTGVRGEAGNGNGVEGESVDGGTGVLGKGNVGVMGHGSPANSGAIGVVGTGRIGVQGTGDISVLGGPPVGRVLEEGPPIVVGILGNAPGDVRHGDVPASYGGWFDALNGTSQLHLEPSSDDGPPSTALKGDLFVDNSGGLWFCVASNTEVDAANWGRIQLA